MDTQQQIEVVIVDIFRKMLGINDKKILQQLYLSVKSKDLEAKQKILNDLIEIEEKYKSIYSSMLNQITIAKNKISEAEENYIDKKELNNLIK